jgi:hypothetical protein
MLVKYDTNQLNGNLISNIFDCPNFYPISYVHEGIADQFKKQSTTIMDADWELIPIDDPNSFYNVRFEDIDSDEFLTLSLKAYKKDSIIGFTFSDGHKMIYPFIETNHKWVKGKDNHYCYDCNIKGWDNNDLIIPDSLMDCISFTVKEIIC